MWHEGPRIIRFSAILAIAISATFFPASASGQEVPDCFCVPVIVAPVIYSPAILAMPTPAGATRWAKTTSAPPSASPYVPPGEAGSGRGPAPKSMVALDSGAAVSEDSPYFDVYPVVPREGDKPAGDTCTVTFLNLANRDVSVTVDGKSQSVARGQKVVVTVPRQFQWQLQGREPRTEQVGMGSSALQIVIRR